MNNIWHSNEVHDEYMKKLRIYRKHFRGSEVENEHPQDSPPLQDYENYNE